MAQALEILLCPRDGTQLEPSCGDDIFEWMCTACPYGYIDGESESPVKVELDAEALKEAIVALEGRLRWGGVKGNLVPSRIAASRRAYDSLRLLAGRKG